MLQCPNCYERQDAGKFCGKCGTPVEEVTVDETEVTEQEEVDLTVDDIQVEDSTKDEPQLDVESESTDGVQTNPAENSTENVIEEADLAPAQETLASSERTEAAEEAEAAKAEAEAAKAISEVAPSGVVEEQIGKAVQQTTESNQATENVKEQASKFWQYYLSLLKNPTKAFQLKEEKFTYGIINILLFAVTFALTLYYAVNVYYKVSYGMFSNDFGESMPFIPVFSRISFSVLILLAIAVTGILVMEKLTIKRNTLKEIIAQYGGIITPLIFVQAVGIITALAGSIIITVIILIGSLIISMFIIPSLFMFEKASNNTITDQKVYISIGTTILNVVLTYFVVRISVFNFLEELLDEISYLF